jgi:glycosyltransferase involved in cell wall biosynthesis
MASAFVYPSFYEGFGIPIIEALYSEVPVIAATGSCLEEAGGAGSLYVNPEDYAELSRTINRVLEDSSLQIQMKLAGLAYAQRFNDKRIANEMMKVYQDAHNHKLNTYRR